MPRPRSAALLILLTGSLGLLPTLATTGGHQGSIRVIVIGDPAAERTTAEQQGCRVIHQFKDRLALECPQHAASRYQPDPILHILDLGAAHAIGADNVWDMGYTGAGVTVALLDTGVDQTHPELSDSIAGGKGFGFDEYTDYNGHGTHIAGIITADGDQQWAKGTAPDTKLWIAKVCSSIGECFSSDVAAAIDYIIDNKVAPIINISLGGTGTTEQNCDTDFTAMKLNEAVNKGIIVAAAAGNLPTEVSSPACASRAIAVGDISKHGVLAQYSGRGSALDVVAPGTYIYSTERNNGYATRSGTSMAAPQVAAAAALILQANPNLTPSNVSGILYSTAKDFGPSGWDQDYGWGMINATAAILLATSSTYDHTPPAISNVTAAEIGPNTIRFSWATEEPSTSQADFGKKSPNENSTAMDRTLVRTHAVYLNVPPPAAVYRYRVKSQDRAGNLAMSQTYSFVFRGASTGPIYISNLALQLEAKGSQGRVVADVTLAGGTTTALEEATVHGKWSGLASSPTISRPVQGAHATFTSDWFFIENGTVTFTVEGVSSEVVTYDPSRNVASQATLAVDLSNVVCTGFATRYATRPGC